MTWIVILPLGPWDTLCDWAIITSSITIITLSLLIHRCQRRYLHTAFPPLDKRHSTPANRLKWIPLRLCPPHPTHCKVVSSMSASIFSNFTWQYYRRFWWAALISDMPQQTETRSLGAIWQTRAGKSDTGTEVKTWDQFSAAFRENRSTRLLLTVKIFCVYMRIGLHVS